MPDLSSLRSLALIVRPMHIKSLLESIQFSHKLAHCRVRPHILLAEYDVEHVLNCVLPFQPQAKSASIEITSSKGNRSVEIHLSTYQEVTALEYQTFSPPISAWDPHSYPLSHYRSSRTPQLDISWSREYASDDLTDSSFPPTSNDSILNKVETLLQEVEVLSLRILTRRGRQPVVDAWLRMLGRLPSILTLDIWQSGVQNQEALLCYLSPGSLSHSPTTATQPFPFKSIKQLNFEGAAFCFEDHINGTKKGLSAQLDNMDPQPSHELFPSIRELFNVIEKRWSDENFALKRLSLQEAVVWIQMMSPYSPVIDQGSSPAVYYAADDDKEEESNYSSN
ncbi:hypothetical protein DL96DRAFT_1704372 [Flagelloscypha sp. PMI_526]|nr:hypothetical protein DL96DRAFT_1704372 [Flagelloscypha sp. PMI_526]